MENAILSLICIAVVLSGGMTLAQSAMLSADQISTEWKKMEVRAEDLARTAIAATDADYTSGMVEVEVENSGQRTLGKFSDWDVVVQYYDSDSTYYIRRLTYATGTSPGDNEWVVYALRFNGNAETFQLGLLDPGEDLMLRLKTVPTLGDNKNMLVVIAAPNGVTTTIQFTR